jgi:hypothetical protein
MIIASCKFAQSAPNKCGLLFAGAPVACGQSCENIKGRGSACDCFSQMRTSGVLNTDELGTKRLCYGG